MQRLAKNLLFLSLLLCICILNTGSVEHAIYVSVIEIDHRGGGSQAEVRVKVFTDDLQNALRNADPRYVPIEEEFFCNSYPEALEPYFKQHLRLSIDGISQRLHFKHCRKENDTFWLTFNLFCPSQWREVAVHADFFMELFPTQSNIIQINHNGLRKHYRLTYSERSMKDVLGN